MTTSTPHRNKYWGKKVKVLTPLDCFWTITIEKSDAITIVETVGTNWMANIPAYRSDSMTASILASFFMSFAKGYDPQRWAMMRLLDLI